MYGNKNEAYILMARALQECPNSGIRWGAAIEMTPRHQRKTKFEDVLKKCGNDPYVTAAAAKFFWRDRIVEKARDMFNQAVTLAPDIGNFWALYYKFELQHGNEVTLEDVLKRCVAAERKHGKLWQSVSKALTYYYNY